MTDSKIIIPDLDLKVTVRRPGHETVRRTFANWHDINTFVTAFAAGKDYPSGTVMTVEDWTGKDRFALRGGATGYAQLVKLAPLKGLPSNPAFEPKAPDYLKKADTTAE